MGYTFHLISKDKEFTTELKNRIETIELSQFNRKGLLPGKLYCDTDWYKKVIVVSGAFGISGHYCEGFVLDLMKCLIDHGYVPRIYATDWYYGSKEDSEFLDNYRRTDTEKI